MIALCKKAILYTHAIVQDVPWLIDTLETLFIDTYLKLDVIPSHSTNSSDSMY